jgi:hypothetical protein
LARTPGSRPATSAAQRSAPMPSCRKRSSCTRPRARPSSWT